MRIYHLFVAYSVVAITTPLCLAFDENEDSRFESPIVLTAGKLPINADGSMLYPSPAVFDIDNDGMDELVVGTIFGEMFACENLNASAEGEPDWDVPKPLETEDGEPIKLNNW